MQRRQFIARSSVILGAVAFAPPVTALQKPSKPLDPVNPAPEPSPEPSLGDWNAVRAQFNLSPDLMHFAGFYLASHPRLVRDAIERHRKALDINPIGYQHERVLELDTDVRNAAGNYLGVRPDDIALTDSTTMGLATLYGSIKLGEGQEILTTTHDHYATWRTLELRAE